METDEDVVETVAVEAVDVRGAAFFLMCFGVFLAEDGSLRILTGAATARFPAVFQRYRDPRKKPEVPKAAKVRHAMSAAHNRPGRFPAISYSGPGSASGDPGA